MKYDVIVGTKVSYRVEVEAESFNQAADKALDYVKNNQSIEGELVDATREPRAEVKCLMIVGSTVEIICAHG